MNESATNAGKTPIQQVEHVVHHAVAHVGAGRIRHERRQIVGTHVTDHGFDGNRGEIGGVAIRTQRGVKRLLAVIIGNARLGKIDGHLFHGERTAATRLPNTDDDVGMFAFQRLFDGDSAARERGGNLLFDDPGARDLAGQQLHRLIRRIDGLAAERVESCYQYRCHICLLKH